jgi:flagellar biosynthesis protein FlhB
MSDKNNGGDKTEKPTPKRLRDSRKKGDLAKSKDFSTAIGVAGWLVILVAASGFVGARLASFMEASVIYSTRADFSAVLLELGWGAFWLVLSVGAITLIPAVISGLAAEFFQTGALFTTEKLRPSLDKLNPVDGLKRMFSIDNLFELAKTLVKAALVLTIVVLVLAASIDEYGALLHAAGWQSLAGTGPQVASAIFDLGHQATIQLFGWTVGVFVLVAFADRAWAKHRHIKKLIFARSIRTAKAIRC